MGGVIYAGNVIYLHFNSLPWGHDTEQNVIVKVYCDCDEGNEPL